MQASAEEGAAVDGVVRDRTRPRPPSSTRPQLQRPQPSRRPFNNGRSTEGLGPPGGSRSAVEGAAGDGTRSPPRCTPRHPLRAATPEAAAGARQVARGVTPTRGRPKGFMDNFSRAGPSPCRSRSQMQNSPSVEATPQPSANAKHKERERGCSGPREILSGRAPSRTRPHDPSSAFLRSVKEPKLAALLSPTDSSLSVTASISSSSTSTTVDAQLHETAAPPTIDNVLRPFNRHTHGALTDMPNQTSVRPLTPTKRVTPWPASPISCIADDAPSYMRRTSSSALKTRPSSPVHVRPSSPKRFQAGGLDENRPPPSIMTAAAAPCRVRPSEPITARMLKENGHQAPVIVRHNSVSASRCNKQAPVIAGTDQKAWQASQQRTGHVREEVLFGIPRKLGPSRAFPLSPPSEQAYAAGTAYTSGPAEVSEPQEASATTSEERVEMAQAIKEGEDCEEFVSGPEAQDLLERERLDHMEARRWELPSTYSRPAWNIPAECM